MGSAGEHVRPQMQITEELQQEAQIREMFSIPSGPPPAYNRSSARSITKPVALPRISNAFDSPFARAYAPELEAHGVSQEKWLEFVDGLSYAILTSPPLQILDTVGRVISVVPFGPALVQTIGNQAASQHVILKSMTDKYLTRANKEYFELRGLRIRLMKGEALKKFIGLTADESKPTTMSKIGKGAEIFFTRVRLPIVTPIAAAVLDAVKPIPSSSTSGNLLSPEGQQQNFVERRMSPLLPYIAPVTFNVPASKLPEGMMQQARAAAAQRNNSRSQRRQFKDDRRRAIGSISRGQVTANGYVQSLQGRSDQTRRDYRDERKAIRDAYRQERRSMRGKDLGKAERSGNMAERRELQDEDKLIWLVVYPLEQDNEIQGVESLDSNSPLVISDGEFQAELEAYDVEERKTQEEEESQAVPPPYR